MAEPCACKIQTHPCRIGLACAPFVAAGMDRPNIKFFLEVGSRFFSHCTAMRSMKQTIKKAERFPQ